MPRTSMSEVAADVEVAGRIEQTEPSFDKFILLAVDIVSASADMIEQIGEMKALKRQPGYTPHPLDTKYLRSALAKAVRAMESYDGLTHVGRETATRDEFDNARHAKPFNLTGRECFDCGQGPCYMNCGPSVKAGA